MTLVTTRVTLSWGAELVRLSAWAVMSPLAWISPWSLAMVPPFSVIAPSARIFGAVESVVIS